MTHLRHIFLKKYQWFRGGGMVAASGEPGQDNYKKNFCMESPVTVVFCRLPQWQRKITQACSRLENTLIATVGLCMTLVHYKLYRPVPHYIQCVCPMLIMHCVQRGSSVFPPPRRGQQSNRDFPDNIYGPFAPAVGDAVMV